MNRFKKSKYIIVLFVVVLVVSVFSDDEIKYSCDKKLRWHFSDR